MARVIKSNGRLTICHTVSREAINQLHQSIGGIVASDLIPNESQLRELAKRAILKTTHFEDVPRRHVIIAEKKSH